MRLSRRKKIGAGVGAAALAATAIVGGTFATFTAQATAPAQSIATGTVKLALNNANATTTYATTPITNMAPGDVVYTYTDLANTGTVALAGVNVNVLGIGSGTAAAPTPTLLTDSTDGLAFGLDACSGQWNTSTGVCYAPGSTTTVGTVTNLVAATTAIGTGAGTTAGTSNAIANAALPAGTSNANYTVTSGIAAVPAVAGSLSHYRITYTLNSAATNAYQGLTDNVDVTFNASQRTAGTFVNTSPTGSLTGS